MSMTTGNGQVVKAALIDPKWLREHDAKVRSAALEEAAQEAEKNDLNTASRIRALKGDPS